MTHYTTIEIDEVETEVKIEFENRFGEMVITKITEVKTGDTICPDLLEGQMTNTSVTCLYNELYEMIADFDAEKSYTRFTYEY